MSARQPARPARPARAPSRGKHTRLIAGTQKAGGGHPHPHLHAKRAAGGGRRPAKTFGGDLLSHPVARAVPSALTGLASGFGMEPGVSPSLWPPKLYGDVTGPPRSPDPFRVGWGVFGSYLGNRIVDANASVHTPAWVCGL